MAYRGVNFRQTAAGGSTTPDDAADDTYWLEGDVYPVTRPPSTGLTFGATAGFTMEGRDREYTDAKLGGFAWSNSSDWRLDLPDGAGTYNIKIALGSRDDATAPNISIKDGSTVLLTLSDASVAANSFVDAAGTERTSADWVSNNVAAQLTFAGTALYLQWNTTGSSCRIAHIALEKVTGGGSTTITADQGSYTLTGQDAGLRATRVLTAEFGTYALTGQAAVLQKDTPGAFTLQVDAGSYSWNGQDALADYAMNAEMGSFALTGQEVTFSIGVPAAYTLSVDPGYYTFNGQNARLDWSGAPIVPNRQAGIYMGMRIGL